MKSTLIAVSIVILTILFWKSTQPELSDLEQQLAQKIMLDIRYYCPDLDSDKIKSGEVKCKTPITQLPTEIAELISDTSLGGVILFAENLSSIEQIIQLTTDLQTAATSSAMAQPLFISIDQEGGRVVRLPREIATSFTGNMSIGNTYKQGDTQFAERVGRAIGAELNALGINVNHAPTVDVNVNPNNPVINVRSFSHDPTVVAKMGIATVNAMQSQGVLATLKHFPGHGDTDVDSHHGLPVVHHDEEMITNVDLYPFQQAIDHSNVNMIMTAHIQYPMLDESKVINKFEQKMIRPATISKVILTDLLREKMGYSGLIITDALDMAGIADFFTPVEATFNTFAAGADIAMMPMKIRTRSDIDGFKALLKTLALKVNEETVTKETIRQSAQRVTEVKRNYIAQPANPVSIEQKVANAKQVLGNDKHRQLEKELASRGLVSHVKNDLALATIKTAKNFHLVTAKSRHAKSLAQYIHENVVLSQIEPKNVSTLNFHAPREVQVKNIAQSDVVIVAVDGIKSVVMAGGVEDGNKNVKNNLNPDISYERDASHNLGNSAKNMNYLDILQLAKEQGKATILVSLNLPIKDQAVDKGADWIITTFDDSTFYNKHTKRHESPALDALVRLLFQS